MLNRMLMDKKSDVDPAQGGYGNTANTAVIASQITYASTVLTRENFEKVLGVVSELQRLKPASMKARLHSPIWGFGGGFRHG